MDDVAVLRHFNRFYTRHIGVLSESYLDTGRPLGPSRVLFEIGDDGARVSALRQRLDLDSGYLSRLLRRLEGEGLVTVVAAEDDGRQRLVRLTAAGRRERGLLDERAEQVARRLVEPLSDRQRADLASALTTAERLLWTAAVRIVAIDPAAPAARAALGRYVDELDQRFPDGFDAGDDEAAAAGLRPPTGTFLVAEGDGVAIGCGGVQRIDTTTAEIKRMWIHPEWRGRGLGARLLATLEQAARDLDHQRVVLDTNGTLTEAVGMYRRAGYQPIERYNDNPYAQHWFAKQL